MDYVISFTFENGASFTIEAGELGVTDIPTTGTWDSPPTGAHANFVGATVEYFVQTDVGASLIYSCGSVTEMSVQHGN